MSVRHLDPESCDPSEILSRTATTKAAKLRKDYTQFGKAMLCVRLLNCAADANLGYVFRYRMLLMDS